MGCRQSTQQDVTDEVFAGFERFEEFERFESWRIVMFNVPL